MGFLFWWVWWGLEYEVYLRVDWNFRSNHEHSFQKTHFKIIPLTKFCYIDMQIIFSLKRKRCTIDMHGQGAGGGRERHLKHSPTQVELNFQDIIVACIVSSKTLYVANSLQLSRAVIRKEGAFISRQLKTYLLWRLSKGLGFSPVAISKGVSFSFLFIPPPPHVLQNWLQHLLLYYEGNTGFSALRPPNSPVLIMYPRWATLGPEWTSSTQQCTMQDGWIDGWMNESMDEWMMCGQGKKNHFFHCILVP